MKNTRGEVIFALIFVMVVGIVAIPVVKTYKNGKLKKNGQVIWCKILNRPAVACEDKYIYTPQFEKP